MMTGCACVVISQFGQLLLLGGDLDNVGIASTGTGATKSLEVHGVRGSFGMSLLCEWREPRKAGQDVLFGAR